MKQLLIIASLLVLNSCKTPAQTISPNNLHGAEATLFLDSGDTLNGKVSLNQEVLFARDIEVKPETGDTRKLHLLDVKAYKANGDYYELKHTENHIHPRSGFYFMKKLTPQGSVMHLYEHIERKQKGKSPNVITYEPVYYLQLPGEKMERVYPSFSRALVPHFHKKMSSYLEGCPELAEKVLNKTPGYFYSRLDATEEQRKEVLLRIIREYDSCRND